MKARKKIGRELVRLQQEQQRYAGGVSWDSRYRFYTLAGKIDVLKNLAGIKKIRREDVEALLQDVRQKYRKIRKIPKHQRSTEQTLEGIYLEGQLDFIQNWVIPELFRG